MNHADAIRSLVLFRRFVRQRIAGSPPEIVSPRSSRSLVPKYPRHLLCVLLGAIAIGPGLQTASADALTSRVDVSDMDVPGNGYGILSQAALSANGRYIVFESRADNLVTGDTNNKSDIFVRDQSTGTTARVSVSSMGVQGNGDSTRASISSDGRYVAFVSSSSNLVGDDTNGVQDVFVHDRQTGETVRASVSSMDDEGNAHSLGAIISADGRYVAFESGSTNLVSGDTNGRVDVFVRDRLTGETERVSVSSVGAELNTISGGAAISADGRFVAFHSQSPNSSNANVFVHDRFTGDTELVSIIPNTYPVWGSVRLSKFPSISADGRYVAFMSEVHHSIGSFNNYQVFVRDRQNEETTVASVSSTGEMGDNDYIYAADSYLPVISADGRYVAFTSVAWNLVDYDTEVDPQDWGWAPDAYLHDRQTGETIRLTVPHDCECDPGSFDDVEQIAISANNRYVAFSSAFSPEDGDGLYDINAMRVYVHDLLGAVCD